MPSLNTRPPAVTLTEPLGTLKAPIGIPSPPSDL